MDERLDRLIKQSGEMWETVRPRTEPLDAVLVKFDESLGKVFELTLPKGEHHPFWRINERFLSADEQEDFYLTSRRSQGPEWQLRALVPMSDGTYMRTHGFIYNGRAQHRWLPSVERVRAIVERVE